MLVYNLIVFLAGMGSWGEKSVILRFLFLEMVHVYALSIKDVSLYLMKRSRAENVTFPFLVMLHVWSICIHRLLAF